MYTFHYDSKEQYVTLKQQLHVFAGEIKHGGWGGLGIQEKMSGRMEYVS